MLDTMLSAVSLAVAVIDLIITLYCLYKGL